MHEVHEAWKRQDRTHTFQGLVQKLKGLSGTGQQSIQSLQHKLKGRLSITHPEARDLLKAMFNSWRSPEPQDLKPLLSSAEKAEKVVDVMFGPIYGIERDEVRIVESPGMNTAQFMEQQRNAAAIVFPVDEQAMYGDDPTAAIYGTLLSLAQLLGPPNERTRERSQSRFPTSFTCFDPESGTTARITRAISTSAARSRLCSP